MSRLCRREGASAARPLLAQFYRKGAGLLFPPTTQEFSPANRTVRGSVKVICSGDGEDARGGEGEVMCVCEYRVGRGGRRCFVCFAPREVAAVAGSWQARHDRATTTIHPEAKQGCPPNHLSVSDKPEAQKPNAPGPLLSQADAQHPPPAAPVRPDPSRASPATCGPCARLPAAVARGASNLKSLQPVLTKAPGVST